jgi:eukaryotic-like serine/threonine-protein kinase
MMERAKPVATPAADLGFPVPADAKKDPWIGQAIKARYQVSRRLAAGPSGDLYIARDGESGAEVTIKLLPAGIALGNDWVRSLRDELSVTRAVARIRPNVAIVHDCDRAADGRAFIVLEPLDGRSLSDLIRQEGPLPVERALRLAFEIADCLQAAHNLVLIHGALDAEHVLVGAEDTVKLMGFEVARLGRASLNTGGLTERADIQAVGLVLMHMLTGEVRPRTADARAHPERAFAFAPQLPAAVRGLVMALVRSPEPRAPDMGSVANALWVELNRVREHQIFAVQGPTPTVRPRAPWRTVGAGVLVVAVLALGAWATWYRATAPAPVTSVIEAVPAARPAPAPPPRVPEPAAAGQSPGVVVAPEVPPPVPRTGPIPPKEPVVKRTPERAQGTAGVQVTAPPVSARGIAAPPADAERGEAVSSLPVRPAPEGGAARPEPRPERDTSDPSAIIDWLLKEYPRRQR